MSEIKGRSVIRVSTAVGESTHPINADTKTVHAIFATKKSLSNLVIFVGCRNIPEIVSVEP